jgi:hypothetical protein
MEKGRFFSQKMQKKFIFCFQNRKRGKSGKKMRKKSIPLGRLPQRDALVLRYEKN